MAVLLAALIGAADASAECKKATVSAFAENYREKEAQAREDAVSAWEDKARGLHGKGWAYWTKSKNPTLVCQPLLKSSVGCTATARPCFYPLGQ
jgi:hypothetical protein